MKSILDNTFLISRDWKSVKVYLYRNIQLYDVFSQISFLFDMHFN